MRGSTGGIIYRGEVMLLKSESCPMLRPLYPVASDLSIRQGVTNEPLKGKGGESL
jgi:hypothetical protein